MTPYLTEAYAAAKKKLGVKNVHETPRLTQVVVNVGVGKKRQDAAWLKAVGHDLKLICGQAAQERTARQAVAGFSVRQGELVGYRVTLRGDRAAHFTERFVKVVLPRVRDFRGLSTAAFDGRGNLSVGVREQLAWPEIRADKTDVIFGLQATFVTSAQTNEEGEQLFRSLGFPLVTPEEQEEA